MWFEEREEEEEEGKVKAMARVKGFYTDSRGRVRPITGRGKRRVRVKTIFFPATYKEAAERISLRTPEDAEASAKWLLSEFRSADTRAKKRRIKRFAVLAHNRAKVMAKNKRLSLKERREAARIARIYYRTYQQMKL